jgi:hypothetical protein
VVRRSKAKLTCLALLGAMLISATTAASSSASAGWFVTGTKLATGATRALASTANVGEPATLNVPSLNIRLTCTGGSSEVLKLSKAFIQGPSAGGAESQACGSPKPRKLKTVKKYSRIIKKNACGNSNI